MGSAEGPGQRGELGIVVGDDKKDEPVFEVEGGGGEVFEGGGWVVAGIDHQQAEGLVGEEGEQVVEGAGFVAVNGPSRGAGAKLASPERAWLVNNQR